MLTIEVGSIWTAKADGRDKRTIAIDSLPTANDDGLFGYVDLDTKEYIRTYSFVPVKKHVRATEFIKIFKQGAAVRVLHILPLTRKSIWRSAIVVKSELSHAKVEFTDMLFEDPMHSQPHQNVPWHRVDDAVGEVACPTQEEIDCYRAVYADRMKFQAQYSRGNDMWKLFAEPLLSQCATWAIPVRFVIDCMLERSKWQTVHRKPFGHIYSARVSSSGQAIAVISFRAPGVHALATQWCFDHPHCQLSNPLECKPYMDCDPVQLSLIKVAMSGVDLGPLPEEARNRIESGSVPSMRRQLKFKEQQRLEAELLEKTKLKELATLEKEEEEQTKKSVAMAELFMRQQKEKNRQREKKQEESKRQSMMEKVQLLVQKGTEETLRRLEEEKEETRRRLEEEKEETRRRLEKEREETRRRLEKEMEETRRRLEMLADKNKKLESQLKEAENKRMQEQAAEKLQKLKKQKEELLEKVRTRAHREDEEKKQRQEARKQEAEREKAEETRRKQAEEAKRRAEEAERRAEKMAKEAEEAKRRAKEAERMAEREEAERMAKEAERLRAERKSAKEKDHDNLSVYENPYRLEGFDTRMKPPRVYVQYFEGGRHYTYESKLAARMDSLGGYAIACKAMGCASLKAMK